MFPKTLFRTFIAFFIFSNCLSAQISGVNYQVKFNEQTNLFDCYLVVKSGSAKTMRERVQFNSQYTMVVPTGSIIEIAENHNPLQNNQNMDSSLPMSWSIANVTSSPGADPFNDYVSISPTLSPAAFYNNLEKGDAVKLFSLKISPIHDCGANVKLFDNHTDPNSNSRGMGGGDFSNGFTVGGIAQKYLGNEPSVTPSLSLIKDVKVKTLKNTLELTPTLIDNAKYGPYSYEWSGPEGFKSYAENVKIKNASEEQYGTYEVVITDNRGCKQTKTVQADIVKHLITNGEAKVTRSSETNNRAVVENSVQIYPNPANSNFNLTVTGPSGANVVVDLMDINGRVVAKNMFKSNIQNNKLESIISLQNVLPGMYNVSVAINDDTTTHKLIVIK